MPSFSRIDVKLITLFTIKLSIMYLPIYIVRFFESGNILGCFTSYTSAKKAKKSSSLVCYIEKAYLSVDLQK